MRFKLDSLEIRISRLYSAKPGKGVCEQVVLPLAAVVWDGMFQTHTLPSPV